MMWKRYSVLILSFAIGINLFIASLNIIYNPYTTYQNDNLYSREPNQNFLKVRYILEHKNKYDSFIFGSSRVGKINPLLLTNGKFYNMTYSEGLPYEHLKNIQLFLAQGINIKNIYIGLDDFSYEVDPKRHENQPMRKLHYLASHESFFDFWTLYKNISLTYLIQQRIGYYDLNNTGMTIVPEIVEENIENNKVSYVAQEKFLHPCHYEGNRIRNTLSELEQIHEICKNHHINLVLFINPIHIKTYLDTNFSNFQAFKKQLVNIQSYYDFSGINEITTNNYFYYETSHYRVKVGNIIANRINGQSNITFGNYVTSQNIESHLAKLRAERAAWQATHPKDVAEIRALKSR